MDLALKRNQLPHPVFHIVEKSTNALLCADHKGNIVYVNEAMSRTAGFSVAHLLQHSLRIIEPHVSLRDVEDRWQSLLKEEISCCDGTLISATGHHFSIRMYALQWDACSPPLLCITSYTANLPQTGSAYLDRFLQAHKAALFSWNLTTDALHISDYFYRLFELEKGQYISRENVFYLLQLNGRQMEELKEAINELRQQPFELEREVTVLRRNGEEKKICIYIKPCYNEGGSVFVQGCIQLLSETGNNKTVAFAKEVMNASESMIFWLNPDFTIRFANREALSRLGYTEREKIAGLKWWHVDIEAIPGSQAALFEQGKKEKSFTSTTKLQHKDGTRLPVKCRYSYVDMEQSSFMYVSARERFDAQQLAEAGRHSAILETMRLHRNLERQSAGIKTAIHTSRQNLLTINEDYKEIIGQAAYMARLTCPVLIQGEIGTGRKSLAKLIHQTSQLNRQPFVRMDCAAEPHLDMKLFGQQPEHTGGAASKGTVAKANGGILLLNEIDCLPAVAQQKVLRLIEDGAFELSGSHKTHTPNIRIIATCRHDLQQLARQGAFSNKLLQHFSDATVLNPPLRQHPSDIPLLARHFLKKYSRKMAKNVSIIPPDDMEWLYTYAFPGNVMELKNIIAHAVLLAEGPVCELQYWRHFKRPAADIEPLPIENFEEMQRQHILKALKISAGRVSGPYGAAALLGINAQTLFSKMKKLGIRI